MSIKRMAQRRDTAANWTAGNPILLSGEIGYETDTGKFKFGNGFSTWNLLGYAGGGITDDEYHEYANLAAFPATGVTDLLYLAQDTGWFYRWNGSAYVRLADKASVGLGNVDNTTDLGKPVSTATQTALDGKTANLVPTAVKTSAYTAAVNDLVACDATTAFTVTLPTAPTDKSRVAVKMVLPTSPSTSQLITIACAGSDVFNKAGGSTSLTLTLVNQAIVLQYKASGAIWYVVSTDAPLGGVLASAATAATTAISTQAVIEVPQLLRPTTPQPTRFPVGSKQYFSAFASGHGWTKNASGTGSTGTVADDTTNFTNGSQSLGITTAGVSVNTFAVSPAFSPTLDLSRNALVLKLRVNTWANLAQVEVLISNDATTAMGTTRATSGALASSASLLAADGEFFWVAINPGQWTNQFSTVDKTAVTRVGVLPASNASGAVTVNVQELWTRPGPSLPATIIAFDDGYLSQFVSAKPIMDKAGFRGVCFPIRNLINNASSTYMSVANLQALYECGWDISAHSDTAAAHDATNALLDSSISDGTASALSSFERELHDNKQWLLANGFKDSADFFAWPQGKFDAARLTIARRYYALIRVYRPALTVADADTYPFVDGGRLRQIAVQSGGSPTAAATVTAALTAAWAAGKTVVMTFHGLGSVAGYEYPIASFQTIIDHIAASGYPVKTLSALMRDNGIDTPVGKTQLDLKLALPTGYPNAAKIIAGDGTLVDPAVGGGTGDATATANSLAQRDANANLVADSFIAGFTTTTTAASTTTLTADSNELQAFTGSTTQTVLLPTTGIPAGKRFHFHNASSGSVTVQSSGGNTIRTMVLNEEVVFTARIPTPTAAADWYYGQLVFQSIVNTPTANAIALRSSQANLQADVFIPSLTSTATAAGTTALTNDTVGVQTFTGSTTQVVTLPTTSIAAGWPIIIDNQSTGILTVNASGGSTAGLIMPGCSAQFTARQATPTTPTHWSRYGDYKGVVTATSTATPTPNADITDVYWLSTLTVGATFGAPTGTFKDGQKLKVRVTSVAAQTLAWNAVYLTSGVAALPTTSVAGKTITCAFEYDLSAAKWVLLTVDATGY